MARADLYSVPELRERGWTLAAIKKFLPAAPDATWPNPRYRRAAWMKAWARDHVHDVEQTDQFRQWIAGLGKRKASAQQAVDSRTNNMMTRMDGVEITIQRGWTDEQIYDLARDTHGGNYRGEPGPFVWSKRTARNCIRHCLTNYEELWALCNRGYTGGPAYRILRARVDALIDEAYPYYAETDESPEAST